MSSVLGAVTPIFALIGLGLAAIRLGWLTAEAGSGLAQFTFVIAMPALLFRTMAVADLGESGAGAVLVSYFLAIAANWLLATLTARWLLGRQADESAVFAMGASYGNLVLIGVPIAISVWGPAAAPTAAVIVSLHVALLWIAGCLHLTLARPEQRGSPAAFVASLAIEVGRNPIVVGILAGSAWRLSGLGIDPVLDRCLMLLAQAGVPCALLAVGCSLARFEIKGERPVLVASLVLKNLVLPAVAWLTTSWLLGPAQAPAAVVILFAAMPTGTAVYLFASKYEVVAEATSATVAASTALSLVTVTGVLYLLALR